MQICRKSTRYSRGYKQKNIGLANGAYNTLRNILNSKKVSRELKLRIFCALIESIFLYNSECWGLNKLLENKIDVVQRKIST